MKKLVILSMLTLAWAPPKSDLVVHEWGTFTSVAGRDGVALDWRPLLAVDDLPSFVYGPGNSRGADRQLRNTKSAFLGLVRMETPVLYFYAEGPTEVSAKVQFPKGILTEWYPAAKSGGNALDWGKFLVDPTARVEYPQESKPSHYYPARETDAAPLRVGKEVEKLLFYRGVGSFALPVQVTTQGSTVTVKNTGLEPLSTVFVFESRGGKAGFRMMRDLVGSGTVERPELGDPQSILKPLESALIFRGLFEKEARAMIKTWRDTWFEEGLRVFYVVPSKLVDEVLPLTIEPKPVETVRVLVGRVEVMTPDLETAALAVMDGAKMPLRAEDVAKTRAQLGRFGEAALRSAAIASKDQSFRTRVWSFLAATQ